MKPLPAFAQLPKAQSWAIVLSMAVTSAGWVAKLNAWPYASLSVMASTALVIVAVTLAVRTVARQVGLPITGPLSLLGTALLLLALEPLCRTLALPASLMLRPLGEIGAALSIVWLLFNVNKVLMPKTPPLNPRYHAPAK